MRLREVFFHVHSQEETNPFGWKHLMRFVLRVGLLAMVWMWCEPCLSRWLVRNKPTRMPIAVNYFSQLQRGEFPHVFGQHTRQGGLWVSRLKVQNANGDAVAIVEDETASSISSPRGLLIDSRYSADVATPLRFIATFGAEPVLEAEAEAVLIDPAKQITTRLALPYSVSRVVDVTPDGRFFLGLRSIGLVFDEMTWAMMKYRIGDDLLGYGWGRTSGSEAVLMPPDCKTWVGTGVRAESAYFDDGGQLIIVSPAKVLSIDPVTMERREYVIGPHSHIVSARFSSVPKDREYVVLVAPFQSKLCRIVTSADGAPKLEEELCLEGICWRLTFRGGMAVVRLAVYRPKFKQHDYYVDVEGQKIVGVDLTPAGEDPWGWPEDRHRLRVGGMLYPVEEAGLATATEANVDFEWVE